MPEHFLIPGDHAVFRAEHSSKVELRSGTALLLGLNCFEPGQSQPVHAHAGADKFYLILSGNARMIVGDSTREAGPGALIWAPMGVPHGVERALERTVMLIGMAPPPTR